MAKRKNNPRKTEAVVNARIDEILRIRLDGAQFHEIVQYASEKGWGVSERQLQTYIARAESLLVVRRDRKRRRVIALHHARRESLYARCIASADYRTALSVLADDAKLSGLYEDGKDLAKQIAALVAQLTAAESSRAGTSERTNPDTPKASSAAGPTATTTAPPA